MTRLTSGARTVIERGLPVLSRRKTAEDWRPSRVYVSLDQSPKVVHILIPTHLIEGLINLTAMIQV
jgi:hypothetical protein